MQGVITVKEALNTLRQHIQRIIKKIGLILGQIVFKVFEGEVSCMVVNPQFVISPDNDLIQGDVSLNFEGAFDLPESVQQALDALMISKFGRVLVDIKNGAVRAICVCSDVRYDLGA